MKFLYTLLFVIVGVSFVGSAAYAWELDTVSDDSNEVSVGSQDGTAFETQFKSDGTKMYVLGYGNDTVYQYSLSSAWDVSSATYDSVSMSVNAQESVPEGMFFKPDGTEMYIIGVSGDDVNQYTLSSAWDLSSATYTGVSPSNSGNDPTSVKVHFNGDGTKMFITGFVYGRVYQYTLSTGWDVTTASYDSVFFSMLAQTSNTYATTFNDTGTRLYGIGPSDVAYQYNLSSAWDISTASYASKSYSFNSKDSNAYGITLKPDGSKLYLTGATGDKVYRYTVNPGDITAPSVLSFSPADEETGVAIDDDLVIVFDESVDVETGNILIKKVSDDSTVETIDVTSGAVTGTGTDTITINPTSNLLNGTSYYVQIPATGFDDAASNSYAGITNTTSWNFTVISSTGGTSYAMMKERYVEDVAVSQSDVRIICDENSAFVDLSLMADNASQYLLSNDASLNAAQWNVFNGGAMDVEWELDVLSEPSKVYYMFKSGYGNLSSLGFVEVYVDRSSCNAVEVVNEEDVEVEENSVSEPGFTMGRSPFNGEFEILTPIEDMDLIMGEHFDAVYLFVDGVRRPFLNESIYYTWYNFQNDIRTVSDATLASVPLGPPMMPKPGGKLVKVVSLPTVFFIEDNGGDGKLVPLRDEDHAREVFGEGWAKNVIDLDVTLFGRFER